MRRKPPRPVLVVALDVATLAEARRLLRQLHDRVKWFKIGATLFTACGPAAVQTVQRAGGRVFLDLKFHDIPSTVAKACAMAVRHRVQMLTVHAGGGSAMLAAAVASVRREARRCRCARPLVVGVTVLTSDGASTGPRRGRTVHARVASLARTALAAGCDGVVASAAEAAMLRRRFGWRFLLVTPGIRPAGARAHDQRRVVTPRAAVRHGADYLIVGRTVTEADDPRRAARHLLREMNDATR